MSTPNLTATEILFTEVEVEQATGVDASTLRQLHPSHFGVPGHWRLSRTGGVLYTAKAIPDLAKALEHYGNVVAAHSLRVLLEQKQATPSRDLISPAPKNASPWFREGQMA